MERGDLIGLQVERELLPYINCHCFGSVLTDVSSVTWLVKGSVRSVSCIVLVYVASISEMLLFDICARKFLLVPFMGKFENSVQLIGILDIDLL